MNPLFEIRATVPPNFYFFIQKNKMDTLSTFYSVCIGCMEVEKKNFTVLKEKHESANECVRVCACVFVFLCDINSH